MLALLLRVNTKLWHLIERVRGGGQAATTWHYFLAAVATQNWACGISFFHVWNRIVIDWMTMMSVSCRYWLEWAAAAFDTDSIITSSPVTDDKRQKTLVGRTPTLHSLPASPPSPPPPPFPHTTTATLLPFQKSNTSINELSINFSSDE